MSTSGIHFRSLNYQFNCAAVCPAFFPEVKRRDVCSWFCQHDMSDHDVAKFPAGRSTSVTVLHDCLLMLGKVMDALRDRMELGLPTQSKLLADL